MKVSLLLLLALAWSACGGPFKPEVNPTPMQDTEKVVLLDMALARYLNVVRHKGERLPGGQLEVKLEMENEEKGNVWADVQVIFRDKDGFELEKTNWEPVQFQGRTVTNFKKNSLNSKADDYRVLIRNIK
jgi:hypothetical protein